MEYTRHLLDNLYPNNHLVLLEAMLPFVDPSMQLPLALYIKFQEVQFILQAFRSPEKLSSCGFHPGNMSNEDLLQSLGRSMGIDLQSQLRQMQQMQSMMSQMNMNTTNENTDHSLFTDDQNMTNDYETKDASDFSHSREEMMEAIREILDEREYPSNNHTES